MKLFDNAKATEVDVSLIPATESLNADEFFLDLGNKIFGWSSVGRVQEAVAAESLTFLDQKNSVLYNEYVSVLAGRMGVEAPKTISLESINADGQLSANYQIALEGWMGDVWKKIKDLFNKIYEKVQQFFKTYFTRLGRLKKALNNLEEVLGSTSKDMADPVLDNPSTSLLTPFKGYGVVDTGVVMEALSSVKTLVSTIGSLNSTAEKFAKDGLLDAGFVSNIKKMKDQALKASQDSEANRAERKETKFLGDGDKKRELDTQNKSLQDIAKSSEKAGEEGSNEVVKLGDGDAGSEDANKSKAQAEYDDFMNYVLTTFDKVKGKNTINGFFVKSVSVDPEEGLKLELEEKSDVPSELRMGNKGALVTAVKAAKDLVRLAEKDIEKFGQVNEMIMKSFKTIDSLVADIDRVDPEKFGKYKKVINETVRHRLNLLRKFFSTYNKTCKNVFDMALDVSDATAKYTVESLKHFE